MPDKGYESLFALLFSNEMTLTKRLASVSHQKEKPVAEVLRKREHILILQALVKAFEMRTMAVGYIKAITEMEISETSSAPVIFRGNTVATKSVDMYMRLTGKFLFLTDTHIIRSALSSSLCERYSPRDLAQWRR